MGELFGRGELGLKFTPVQGLVAVGRPGTDIVLLEPRKVLVFGIAHAPAAPCRAALL